MMGVSQLTLLSSNVHYDYDNDNLILRQCVRLVCVNAHLDLRQTHPARSCLVSTSVKIRGTRCVSER